MGDCWRGRWGTSVWVAFVLAVLHVKNTIRGKKYGSGIPRVSGSQDHWVGLQCFNSFALNLNSSPLQTNTLNEWCFWFLILWIKLCQTAWNKMFLNFLFWPIMSRAWPSTPSKLYFFLQKKISSYIGLISLYLSCSVAMCQGIILCVHFLIVLHLELCCSWLQNWTNSVHELHGLFSLFSLIEAHLNMWRCLGKCGSP